MPTSTSNLEKHAGNRSHHEAEDAPRAHSGVGKGTSGG